MKTLTINNEFKDEYKETIASFSIDTPRPGDGDETVDPKKPKPDPNEEDEDEVRPQAF
ncbi:hypothetical protein U8527_04890 [Kordia algicida OT-1]|uniref:Uncharacterized protein n=1 Tax=Kordia algicida OT-1 TaxID=391587 RepID=A9DM97_9FLAO|nr:hypothetical protein [Kordia algicida]EDP97657.1 hypothetical protein KAOT1_20882 [Kordia algicida OT-1]